MFVVTGFFCLSRFYSWLTVVHFVKEIDVAVPLLAVQSAALLDVDGDDSHGGEADHDYEAHEFAEEDGGQQEAEEAQADGSGGIGQEPAADAHELQWLLESLENRDAVEIDVDLADVLFRIIFMLYMFLKVNFQS